jgi:hypothetical protein
MDLDNQRPPVATEDSLSEKASRSLDSPPGRLSPRRLVERTAARPPRAIYLWTGARAGG